MQKKKINLAKKVDFPFVLCFLSVIFGFAGSQNILFLFIRNFSIYLGFKILLNLY